MKREIKKSIFYDLLQLYLIFSLLVAGDNVNELTVACIMATLKKVELPNLIEYLSGKYIL